MWKLSLAGFRLPSGLLLKMESSPLFSSFLFHSFPHAHLRQGLPVRTHAGLDLTSCLPLTARLHTPTATPSRSYTLCPIIFQYGCPFFIKFKQKVFPQSLGLHTQSLLCLVSFTWRLFLVSCWPVLWMNVDPNDGDTAAIVGLLRTMKKSCAQLHYVGLTSPLSWISLEILTSTEWRPYVPQKV